jgi:FtsP/CotA-like multicopper oxidase with cupredoxin domain
LAANPWLGLKGEGVSGVLMVRFVCLLVLGALLMSVPVAAQTVAPPAGVVRTWYIAADEVDWDYVPLRKDLTMGMAMPLTGYAKAFVEHRPDTIGSVYRKAIYREYTDATFAHLKPRPTGEAYRGLLGPVLHAEVGDTIRIVFRNHAHHPYSMHPHGVLYDKASEGMDPVAPGATATYIWHVTDRSGPGPNDPSSIVWLYHSHVDERRDVNAGLIGAIVVTRRGMARPDGTPKDVDREIPTLYMIFDENQSPYIDDDIHRYIKKPKKGLKFDGGSSVDPNGNNDPFYGNGFAGLNLRFTINGFSFGNMPMPAMHVGERVRWYVMTIGEGLNGHSAHWHGNTVVVDGHNEDVVPVLPAQALAADMVPDNPGVWMVHCHFDEHMRFGMVGYYRVLP